MKIVELTENKSASTLMRLLVFLRSRAERSGSKAQISMDALSNMAQSVGIPLNYDSFDALYQSNPNFANLIADYNQDKVILNLPGDKASPTISSKADLDTEPVTKVDKMAKRALRKRT